MEAAVAIGHGSFCRHSMEGVEDGVEDTVEEAAVDSMEA